MGRLLARVGKPRLVRVRSWDDLPEVLEPGIYEVDGERFEIYEPVEKEVWRMAVKGIKRLHREYYG